MNTIFKSFSAVLMHNCSTSEKTGTLKRFMFHISGKRVMSFVSGVILLGVILIQAPQIFAQKAMDSSTLPWDDLRGASEIVSLRDANTKHFALSEGGTRAFVASGVIHYKRNGIWEDIDNSIHVNNSGRYPGYPYCNIDNTFQTFFPSNPFQDPLVSEKDSVLIYEFLKGIEFIDQNGVSISSLPIDYSSIQVSVNANQIQYTGFYPGLKLIYEVSNSSRKFDLVIEDNSFLSVIPQAAVSIAIIENIYTANSTVGFSVDDHGLNVFKDDEVLVQYPTPVSFDENLSNEGARETHKFEIDQIANGVTFKSLFKVSWVASSERSFPLHLDPVANFLPTLTTNWTGYQSSSTSKTSGFLRITGSTTASWAKYNISSIPPSSTINTVTYFGRHYTGSGNTTAKQCRLRHMSSDPVPASAATLWNQSTTGTIVSSNFIWAQGSSYQWRSVILNTSGVSTLQGSLSQGWYALGAQWVSGGTSFSYHYGVNGTTATCTYLSIDYTSTGYNPCSPAPPTLSCGVTTSYSMGASAGAWNSYGGPYSVPGQEKLFQFTPAVTGTYAVGVTVSSGYNDLFWKPVSSGCNASGWTYVDDIITSATNNVNLTAGVSYYFLLDDEDQTGNTGSITITCPSTTYNPCTSIPVISNCGVTATASMNGTGAGWNVTNCGYSTPGQEQLFQFTAPTTGTYQLNVSAITGGWIDFFWKPASSGCNATGWNCIDDIIGTGTYSAITPMNFTAGVTYYILLDPEGSGSYSSSFSLVCPAPTYNPCTSIPVISNCGVTATASMNGTGAGWNVTNCGYSTPGQEQLFQFTAPTTGTYQLNVSAITGGYIDFFWKPASSGCNATGWNCIDDIISTGTYSAITPMNFTAGVTYYILLDPEGTGSYSSSFSMVCPVVATPNPTSVTASSSSICVGNSVTLTAGGPSGTVYWFTTGCNTTGQIATGNSITVSPTATTTYYARNYNNSLWSAGCASTTVTVNTPAVAPTAASQTICYGANAQIVASANADWYTQPVGGTLIGTGTTFTTPPLLASTTYYMEGASTVSAPTMMAHNSHQSIFSGNVRGYFFTAPVNFTIVGLKTPPEITGNQSIAVVRFTAGPPPLYAATTNNFTVLYLTQNNPSTSILPVNIPVTQGDIIGILGQAGTTNSYTAGPVNTTIAGQPVTLARLGMQFQLTTTAPQQLWTENSGSISRVEMYYTVSNGCPSTSRNPVTVNVNAPPNSISAATALSTGCNIYSPSSWSYFVEPNNSIVTSVWSSNNLNAVSADVSVLSSVPYQNGVPYMPRVVSISPGSQGAATVRLYFTWAEFQMLQAAEPQLTNITQLGVTKFDNPNLTGNPMFISPSAYLTPAQTNIPNVYAVEVLTPSFSTFTLHFNHGNTILPVEFTSQTAVCESSGVSVQWSTASESQCSHYEVFRSFDGFSYEKIGSVVGAGTTSMPNDYRLFDPIDWSGPIYYRIDQFDYNGDVKRSPLIVADCKGRKLRAQIVPNPANSSSTLVYDASKSGIANLYILDSRGNLIKQSSYYFEEGANTVNLLWDMIESGLYTIRVEFDGEQQNLKQSIIH